MKIPDSYLGIAAGVAAGTLAAVVYEVIELHKSVDLMNRGMSVFSDIVTIHDDYIKVINHHVSVIDADLKEDLLKVQEKWKFTSIVEEWEKPLD